LTHTVYATMCVLYCTVHTCCASAIFHFVATCKRLFGPCCWINWNWTLQFICRESMNNAVCRPRHANSAQLSPRFSVRQWAISFTWRNVSTTLLLHKTGTRVSVEYVSQLQSALIGYGPIQLPAKSSTGHCRLGRRYFAFYGHDIWISLPSAILLFYDERNPAPLYNLYLSVYKITSAYVMKAVDIVSV